MNRKLALQLVSNLKDELPVPSETCPAINAVQGILRKVTQRTVNTTDRDSLMSAYKILEDLRGDNNALRELGK